MPPPESATIPPPSDTRQLTPQQQYDAAMALLRASDYAGAGGGLQLFLELNPEHELAASAAYWLVETFYVRRNYAAAAAASARNYRTYGRTAAKAPDNLLKLGMSLKGLGETGKACLSYDELSREFPNAPVHIQEAVARERARADCDSLTALTQWQGARGALAKPLPIAITLYGDTSAAEQRGRMVADVVTADLESSGLFQPIDQRTFLQSPSELQRVPRFSSWRQIKAEALVTGIVSGGEDGGKLTVEFRLWDVLMGVQIHGLRFQTSTDNWRRVAHMIAEEIYKRITGDSVAFDSGGN